MILVASYIHMWDITHNVFAHTYTRKLNSVRPHTKHWSMIIYALLLVIFKLQLRSYHGIVQKRFVVTCLKYLR